MHVKPEAIKDFKYGKIPTMLLGDLNGCREDAKKVFENLESAMDHPDAMEEPQPEGEVITCHNDIYHTCGELDKILVSKPWRVSGFAQIFKEERLISEQRDDHPERSMPNTNWPSDHISLVANIVFDPKKEAKVVVSPIANNSSTMSQSTAKRL